MPTKSYRGEFLSIIGLLLLFNYFNFYYSLGKIDYSKINELYAADFAMLFKQVSAVNIFLSQVGGLFFQTVLVFLLGMVLDTEISFGAYMKCVGLSYVGYLIAATILFLYNLFTMEQLYSLNDFNTIMTSSFFRVAIGKMGEFWSLTILSLLIFKCANGRVAIYWSIFNAFFPSVLILLSGIAFNLVFVK